jgi:hypothetical protein
LVKSTIAAKRPNFGGFEMPKISEHDIQRALCGWLDGWPDKHGVPTKPPALLPDALYWHTPNGGARDAVEGARFKQIGVKPGIFDLTFLRAGGLYVLELKDERGRLSPAQLKMWTRYQNAGAAGIAWANNLAAAKAQLFLWGLVDNKQ